MDSPIISKLKKLMEAVKFEHTIFSLPFILIGMVVGAGGWLGWRLLFLGILAGVSARTFAMMVNRLMDREFDRLNPRTANRPTATGEVSILEMWVVIIVSGLLFILSAYLTNRLAFLLSFPILAVLAGYSYMKRVTPFAHLVLGVALGLAPIAGAIAVTGQIPCWSIFLGVGVAFWVAGFDLLYSIQDIQFDREAGLFSIPAVVGAEGALLFSRLFHTLAVLFWALFTAYAHLGVWGWVAVIGSALLLFWEQKLVASDYRNIPKAFFDLNGLLGIFYLIAVILNYL
jgi:4-hydroxybenzoate polyprenyltransferase